MKILFLIFTVRKRPGLGGHYYSLKTTFDEVNKQFDGVIINIGRNSSPVIDTINGKTYNILYESFNPYKIFMQLKEIFESEKPDIIHSFDVNSLFFARILSFRFKKPHIHTKCGGQNPPNFYPHVQNLILYSEENYKFFKAWWKFSKSNIYIIPNLSLIHI